MDWFIGDTHFGHARLLTFESNIRPYTSIEEHDEALIANWNSVVGDDDVVYHLGDVSFSSKYEPLFRLKGRKIVVVLGNHDYHSKIEHIMRDERYRVCGCMSYRKGLLTHIPVHESQLTRYEYNIHGHLHHNNLPDKRYVNVSAEQTGMTPISWDQLKERL